MNRADAKSAQADFVETDPIFLWAEENWIQPCMATLPQPLHGLCMYGPVFVIFGLMVAVVALLAYCEKKQKTEPAAAASTKAATKEETKKKK